MSDTQAQGSIILKILVVIASLILIAVILIPGQIWENEEKIKSETLSDIESLYNAQRYFYNLNQNYTTDMNELLTTVKEDSVLKERKQIVEYTVKLKTAIDDFLEQPIIKSLVKISQNISSIESDFENNTIYFAKYNYIKEKSEDLKFKVIVMKAGVEQEEYSLTAKSLDSLLNLRRDLTDYQLQVAARRSHALTNSIVTKLPEINFKAISDYWKPLNLELTDLMNEVNSKDSLKQRTAVADRVADFQQSISSGFRSLEQGNIQNEINNAKNASEKVKSVYDEFLADYLTTSKYVQYSLTDVDSMLLYLNENNFFSPLDNKPYSYQFMDTLGLVVEDPTLLDELKESALNQVSVIHGLTFYEPFLKYLNVLDSINTYAAEVKTKYRRNAEVHFKTKDIAAVIENLKATSTLTSFESLNKFVSDIPNSNSFSDIKTMVENTLLGVGLFKQIVNTQIYGKLDTVHQELLNEMNNFDELLSGIRRNTYSFESLKAQIEDALSQIKSNSTGGNLSEILRKSEAALQEIYLFAEEGKDESVYGIFTTKIINHGKMYGRTGEKSWEEE